MQKMGFVYETYMSKLGFCFDMYAIVDAYGHRGKKQKTKQSSKVQQVTTDHSSLKALFHGHERKRKDGWVPEGAKTGTSVVPSYNRANDDCSIIEMPLFNGVN